MHVGAARRHVLTPEARARVEIAGELTAAAGEQAAAASPADDED
jgi:hypothetical protein